MALIPTWYSASTKQIAEKALQRGVLKYPGLCYIQDSKSIAWVTIDNTLEYVKGDKQITDVKCIESNLMFFSGDKLLFSYDISMTDEDKGHIVEEVKKTIGLDNYVKSSELSTLLDNIIGNLEDKSTVVDYINSLSYNKLSDVPIVNLIGTLTIPADAKAKDVVNYIKEAVTAGKYDDSALKASVAANTAAIGTLNGTGDGSVKKAVADAVAKIVADAPEAYDTLKEISDWISTHTSDAATMNSQIKTNKEDITKLKTLIGTLPESATSKDIVGYIAEYVSKALADSDLSKYAKAADLEAAVGRIDAIEKKLPTLEAADKKNAEDITAVKGRMDTAEGKITAVEKDLATEKPKIAKNTSDIAALKGLVGDGYEAIPSASIKGLFSA